MKKDRWFLRMLALLALSGVLMTTALAAEAGSTGDPLVTLSYLNDTFMNTIMERVDQKIAERAGGMSAAPSTPSAPSIPTTGSASSAASFTVVTLFDGQVLTGDIGCEVLLRIGAATCVSSGEPGLVDETTAGTLGNGGALETNHLYMMTIEGRGVRASAATVKLMVRGSYTVS